MKSGVGRQWVSNVRGYSHAANALVTKNVIIQTTGIPGFILTQSFYLLAKSLAKSTFTMNPSCAYKRRKGWACLFAGKPTQITQSGFFIYRRE